MPLLNNLEVHINVKPTPTGKFGATGVLGDGRYAFGVGESPEKAVAAVLVHLSEVVRKGEHGFGDA